MNLKVLFQTLHRRYAKSWEETIPYGACTVTTMVSNNDSEIVCFDNFVSTVSGGKICSG